ncbi:DUF3052 family protein [Leptospira wolffii]|uniref:DUF3052 domain-containing protein n=1 Tax=Leptospira wolffii TaxID=409998 RepID=A0A2M9ZFE0_9LEPT|nr:DUF3052 family protein [Leptospira wolffii]EPG64742.1 hypothetical protein LEP1GSC061_3111 [Leptospira wolffii serovar Khorat str. Khorat-H2]PJZ67126.1 DUF3052 domain-containing protein [Leptospira wolffii]TGL54180.1 DUF3052 family protein [Leptospira wolffii]
MAGYSGTPLVKKLGFKEGQTAILLKEPKGFRDLLEGLPSEIRFKKKLDGDFDYIHFFCKTEEDLKEFFPQFPKHLADKGMVWISWPKSASGVKTDLKEDKIREIGLKTGLVDVKVCAIDSVWSGLLFRRRKA